MACARISIVLFFSFFFFTSICPHVKRKPPKNTHPPHITHSLSYAVQGNHLILCCQRGRFRVPTLVSKMQKPGDRLSLITCFMSVQGGVLTTRTILQRTMELWKAWRQLKCCASEKKEVCTEP